MVEGILFQVRLHLDMGRERRRLKHNPILVLHLPEPALPFPFTLRFIPIQDAILPRGAPIRTVVPACHLAWRLRLSRKRYSSKSVMLTTLEELRDPTGRGLTPTVGDLLSIGASMRIWTSIGMSFSPYQILHTSCTLPDIMFPTLPVSAKTFWMRVIFAGVVSAKAVTYIFTEVTRLSAVPSVVISKLSMMSDPRSVQQL